MIPQRAAGAGSRAQGGSSADRWRVATGEAGIVSARADLNVLTPPADARAGPRGEAGLTLGCDLQGTGPSRACNEDDPSPWSAALTAGDVIGLP